MDIVFSSTAQLAAAVQAKHVSATEVLDAHLAQIEAHNPTLNAIVTLDAERAHERARQADDALARGDVWGPLHGVPFTLKEASIRHIMQSMSNRRLCECHAALSPHVELHDIATHPCKPSRPA